ncbi:MULTISPECIES: glycosyltransferase [Ramlibacter]|uniref:glycosyltransferase family 4 protein n=1 Tax=Ramlibacter TaxID=174951 RepID=UPI00257AC345|nr:MULTISPECIES: glycosyltransferase [Ramlibacter]
MLWVLCVAVSAIACTFIVRYGRYAGRRYALNMPQRFHAGHVPRLGGLGMLAGCSFGWLWGTWAERWFAIPAGLGLTGRVALGWFLTCALAAGAGLAEDLTHRLHAKWRLGLTVVAGGLAVLLLDLNISRLGIPLVDAWWAATPWPGLLLAVFAIAGLPHAFNLIDGYNGLAGTVAVICCAAIAYVSLLHGDRQLAALVVVTAGATIGFLLWNYPHGLIFAGDGGAYLWGVVIAMACIALVDRHPDVSPFFPVLLLIYPVWETLFSIWRKLARGQSPGMADALHFHQLIYRRIVRSVIEDDEARRMLMRNNRTSPYLWGFALLTVLPAVLFWNRTPALLAFTLLFIASYVWAYVSIVRFKVPRWLQG